MQKMGEPLEDNEVEYLIQTCNGMAPNEDAEAPKDEVHIESLSKILCPSDDIIEDLTQAANNAIRKADIERKLKESMQGHVAHQPEEGDAQNEKE